MLFKRTVFLIIGCLLAPPSFSQDVETQYLKLQESYTLRIQDIQDRYGKIQRELLNKFILALVRLEQTFRDNGDLNGVVYCRELREKLLTTPGFPNIEDEPPAAVADMLKTLEEKKQKSLEEHQKELSHFNVMLLGALEAYEREFTRQGMIKRALEIQSLRAKITLTLSQELEQSKIGQNLSSTLSVNPNEFPIAIEAKNYADITGIAPRTSMHELSLNKEDIVRMTDDGIVFVNGHITIPANQTGPLVEDVKRNRMFFAEVAFEPTFDAQGYPGNPVVIAQFGKTLDTAQFALTLEGQSVWVYFATSMAPADRMNYRYEIGSIRNLRSVHIVVTYRAGEFTTYLNGVATQRLRNEIRGTIFDWETAPLVLGRALTRDQPGMIFPFRGTLKHLYFKSGDLTSRQVVTSYNRYLLSVD